MPLTKEQLDNWFIGHPVTDETGPKYAAIRKAEEAAAFCVDTVCAQDANDPNEIRNDNVNKVLRAFAEVIDANAPDSADKTAAIRCVRLARFAANEAVYVPGAAPRLMAVAKTELQKARMQANSAIACGGK